MAARLDFRNTGSLVVELRALSHQAVDVDALRWPLEKLPGTAEQLHI